MRKIKFEKQLKYLEQYEKQRLITLKQIVALHQHSNSNLSKETSIKLNLSVEFIEWFFYRQRSIARELIKKIRKKAKKDKEKQLEVKLERSAHKSQEIEKSLKKEPIFT
jgi:hypothetical protein